MAIFHNQDKRFPNEKPSRRIQESSQIILYFLHVKKAVSFTQSEVIGTLYKETISPKQFSGNLIGVILICTEQTLLMETIISCEIRY